MAWILAVPIEFRIFAIFLLGTVIGSWLNLAIYTLAWNPRSISPWSRAPLGVPLRGGRDRLPIIGWWGLRREARLHGTGFWVRPMLIEFGVGASLAALYWWEVVEQGLLLQPHETMSPAGAFLNGNLQGIVHAQFAAHVLLFALMLVASFIDIDEKIIPDTITIPGTLAGLLLATMCPWSLLDGNCWLPTGGVEQHEFAHICAPNPWPQMLNGTPQLASLAIALGCWWSWCVAIMPRRWITRRGVAIAIRVLCARLYRTPTTWWITGLGLVGTAAIYGIWQFASPITWAGLLTSLVGMAASGGMIWLVRVIGSHALGREAMGFGDVTLMAMVGTFIGWQAALITFFIAPFAGLLIGIAQWMLHREHEIPYGPFLCLATAFVIVAWASVWQSTEIYFELGWLVPGVVGFCLVLMGVMLWLWRMVRNLLWRP